MKKILLGTLISITTLVTSAQVSDTANTKISSHKYYYYPKSNVYFDQVSGNYWFWDKTSSQWKMTTTTPSGVILLKDNRQPLSYRGDEPWKNNAADMKKYKVKKDPGGK